MAYDVKGWRRGPEMGSISTGVGAVKYKHFYVTNDDAATIQTAAYFNPLAGQLSKGDLLEVSLAVGSAPVTKTYIVTSATGATPVVISLQTTT